MPINTENSLTINHEYRSAAHSGGPARKPDHWQQIEKKSTVESISQNSWNPEAQPIYQSPFDQSYDRHVLPRLGVVDACNRTLANPSVWLGTLELVKKHDPSR